LKEEALDRTMRRARFGRGFGPVVRKTIEWIYEWRQKYQCHSILTSVSTLYDVTGL